MRRALVDSSVIAAIGYDLRKHELEIEFLSEGNVYRYFEVPPEEHQAFMAAESKGQYLSKVFKLRGYRYAIVGRKANIAAFKGE